METIKQSVAATEGTVVKVKAELAQAKPPATLKPITENEVLNNKEALSKAKHSLMDLQTKKSLSSALASENPFAEMEARKTTVDRDFSSKRAANRAVKVALENAQEENARQSEILAGLLVDDTELVGRLEAAVAAVKAELENESSVFKSSNESGSIKAGVMTITVPHLVPAASEGESDAIAYSTVTLTTESEARKLMAELTLFNAMLKSSAMADAVAAARLKEKNAATAAEIERLKAQLEAVQRERVAHAKSVVTEASRAEEAAAFFNGLSDTLKAVFFPPAPAPSAANGAAAMKMAVDGEEETGAGGSGWSGGAAAEVPPTTPGGALSLSMMR